MKLLCLKCKQEKDASEFSKDNRSKERGHQAYCKECQRLYHRLTKSHHHEVTKLWRQNHKEQVMNHYGNKCACCGESRIEFLTIDHIHGGGNKHRKEIHQAGGSHFYRWLINNGFPEGFRVLCFNCNCSLGFHGYCPHQNGSINQK